MPTSLSIVQRRGLAFERKAMASLRLTYAHCEHNPWFAYSLKLNQDENYCVPDVLLLRKADGSWKKATGSNLSEPKPSGNAPNANVGVGEISTNLDLDSIDSTIGAIVIEVKLSYKVTAMQKLRRLYIPVVEMALGVKALPLVIVRHLDATAPKASRTLSEAFDTVDPIVQWLGSGDLR